MNRFQSQKPFTFIVLAMLIAIGVMIPTFPAQALSEGDTCKLPCQQGDDVCAANPEEPCDNCPDGRYTAVTYDTGKCDIAASTATSTAPNLIDWTITGIKNIWGKVVTGVENVATGWLDKQVEKLVNWFIGMLANVMNAIATLEVFFIVAFAHPALFKFATAPFVHTGWYVSLQIANLLLVLGLMYLANKFILGKEKFGDYTKLIKYITYAIFINFSLSIASFFIGISNYLTLAFLNLGGASTETHISSTPPTVWDIAVNFGNRLAGVFESLASLNDVGNASAISSIANGLVLVLFSIMLVIILGAIAFGFIRRVIMLWVLMMIMPLAYVLDIVGVNIGGKIGAGASKLWQDNFMKQLSFGPIMAFGLWFTLLIMARVGEAYTNIEAGGEFTDIFQSIQHIIQPIVFIVLLVFVFTQATAISGQTGKGFDKAMGWAQNLPQKAGEGIKKWTKEGAQYMGAQASKGFFDSKTGQSLKNSLAGKRGLLGAAGNWLQRREDATDKTLSGRADQYTSAVNSMSKEGLWKAAKDPARTEPFRAAAFTRLKEKHSDWLAYQFKVDPAHPEAVKDELEKIKKMEQRYGKEFKPDEIMKYRPSVITDNAKRQDAIQGLSNADLIKVEKGELLNPTVVPSLTASHIANTLVTRKFDVGEASRFVNLVDNYNRGAVTDLNLNQASSVIVGMSDTEAKRKMAQVLYQTRDNEFRKKLLANGTVATALASLVVTGSGLKLKPVPGHPSDTYQCPAGFTPAQRDAELRAAGQAFIS